jgi:hypothetical protein
VEEARKESEGLLANVESKAQERVADAIKQVAEGKWYSGAKK